MQSNIFISRCSESFFIIFLFQFLPFCQFLYCKIISVWFLLHISFLSKLCHKALNLNLIHNNNKAVINEFFRMIKCRKILVWRRPLILLKKHYCKVLFKTFSFNCQVDSRYYCYCLFPGKITQWIIRGNGWKICSRYAWTTTTHDIFVYIARKYHILECAIWCNATRYASYWIIISRLKLSFLL